MASTIDNFACDDERGLEPSQARQQIRAILREGIVSFSMHALLEMGSTGLSEIDCTNALRGGHVEFTEMVRGTWRYRVRTHRLVVVVAFRSEFELRVGMVWRADR